jgi:hypothetical protein
MPSTDLRVIEERGRGGGAWLLTVREGQDRSLGWEPLGLTTAYSTHEQEEAPHRISYRTHMKPDLRS